MVWLKNAHLINMRLYDEWGKWVVGRTGPKLAKTGIALKTATLGDVDVNTLGIRLQRLINTYRWGGIDYKPYCLELSMEAVQVTTPVHVSIIQLTTFKVSPFRQQQYTLFHKPTI
jgi:hypothetical protein